MTLLLLGALVLALPGADVPHALVGGGVGAVLGWLADVDRRTHRVPNRVVLPATAALLGVLLAWAAASGEAARFGSALVGASGAALALLALTLVTRGGFGLGDAKAALLVGLWTGWLAPWGPVRALVAAVLVGGIAALVRARSTGLAGRVPFVPALAAGAAFATWWTRWGF